MPAWRTVALWIAAAGVLATIALGLVRVERGPSNGDRMLAAQLPGTGAVAVLLLLTRAAESPALLDVALVLALLADDAFQVVRLLLVWLLVLFASSVACYLVAHSATHANGDRTPAAGPNNPDMGRRRGR